MMLLIAAETAKNTNTTWAYLVETEFHNSETTLIRLVGIYLKKAIYKAYHNSGGDVELLLAVTLSKYVVA